MGLTQIDTDSERDPLIRGGSQVLACQHITLLQISNRSATVVTAYLMIEHGWDRDTALAFLQQRRPQARPDPGMMRLLEDFEQELQEKGNRP